MGEPGTSLAVTDTVSPKAVGIVIAALGAAIAVWHLKIGLAVAAIGVFQWFFVARSRWLFDKVAGTAALVDESGLKTEFLRKWPLGEITGVISRHRIIELSDSTDNRYDLALVLRSGAEQFVSSFGSPGKAEELAAFLGLELQQVEAGDSNHSGKDLSAFSGALGAATLALWREKGLHGFTRKEEAIPFLESYVRDHPDDAAVHEMLGSLLAANGESSRAAQGLQDAARIYRTRGEIENAVRAERAVKRLTS